MTRCHELAFLLQSSCCLYVNLPLSHIFFSFVNIIMYLYIGVPIEASRGTRGQACDCKRDRLWIRFPLEEIKYLMFSFHCSGVEAKCDVDFRHSTRTASRIRQEMRNESVLVVTDVLYHKF